MEAAPITTPTSDVLTADHIQDLYEKAKEEETVKLYHAIAAEDVVRAVIEPFKALFPDVNVELFSTGSTSALTERVLSEEAAGVDPADVIITGGPGLIPLIDENLLEAYESPSASRLRSPEEMQQGDNLWTATGVRVNLPVANTECLAEDERPSDWMDFADPPSAWEGKVGMLDPRLSGAGFSPVWALYDKFGDQADEIFLGLKEIDVRLYPEPGALQEGVTSGEICLAFLNSDLYPALAILEGAPVSMLEMESGAISYFVSMSLFKGGAHPNAARLLYEFVLSPEGQKAQAQRFPQFPSVTDVQPIEAYPDVEDLIVVDDVAAARDQEELLQHWTELAGL